MARNQNINKLICDYAEHFKNKSEALSKLLEKAVCPCCDGSGSYYDNMGEVCQCQWCYEKNLLITTGDEVSDKQDNHDGELTELVVSCPANYPLLNWVMLQKNNQIELLEEKIAEMQTKAISDFVNFVIDSDLSNTLEYAMVAYAEQKQDETT